MSLPMSAASPRDQRLLWVWIAVVTWCSEKKIRHKGTVTVHSIWKDLH